MNNLQISHHASVSLRALPVSDLQAEELHQGLIKAGLAVVYLEEQHGPTLVVHVRCTPIQERAVRNLFCELGLSIVDEDPDSPSYRPKT